MSGRRAGLCVCLLCVVTRGCDVCQIDILTRLCVVTLECVVCQMEILDSVRKAVQEEYYTKFDDCVGWARRLFQANYSNTIRQLLFNFPADQVCVCRLLALKSPWDCRSRTVSCSSHSLRVTDDKTKFTVQTNASQRQAHVAGSRRSIYTLSIQCQADQHLVRCRCFCA